MTNSRSSYSTRSLQQEKLQAQATHRSTLREKLRAQKAKLSGLFFFSKDESSSVNEKLHSSQQTMLEEEEEEEEEEDLPSLCDFVSGEFVSGYSCVSSVGESSEELRRCVLLATSLNSRSPTINCPLSRSDSAGRRLSSLQPTISNGYKKNEESEKRQTRWSAQSDDGSRRRLSPADNSLQPPKAPRRRSSLSLESIELLFG